VDEAQPQAPRNRQQGSRSTMRPQAAAHALASAKESTAPSHLSSCRGLSLPPVLTDTWGSGWL
jgi:hypothetical protein